MSQQLRNIYNFIFFFQGAFAKKSIVDRSELGKYGRRLHYRLQYEFDKFDNENMLADSNRLLMYQQVAVNAMKKELTPHG